MSFNSRVSTTELERVDERVLSCRCSTSLRKKVLGEKSTSLVRRVRARALTVEFVVLREGWKEYRAPKTQTSHFFFTECFSSLLFLHFYPDPESFLVLFTSEAAPGFRPGSTVAAAADGGTPSSRLGPSGSF